MSESITLKLDVMEKLVPFFIEWDEHGKLVLVSGPLAQVWGEPDLATLASQLVLSRPFDADFNPQWLPELTELTVHLQLKSKLDTTLKGQVIERDQGWLFAGFPIMHSISDLDVFGLKLSDLPIHDGVGDLLIATETSRASLLESQQTAANLEIANEELISVNESFSRFVPKEFLDELGHQTASTVSLGDHVGTRKCVMFADLRQFTKISESMKSHDIFHLINRYLSAVSPCIRNAGGFVCQYLGDGIMALFPGDSDSAIRGALEMQTAIKNLSTEINLHGFTLRMGIGIHFGQLELGIIGETYRWHSSIISDAVNTASRVEGLTKTFGAEILVTKSALDCVPNHKGFQYRRLGKVEIKGRSEKVSLYEILDSLPPRALELKNETRPLFEQALTLYEAEEHGQAQTLFETILRADPADMAAKFYLRQISLEASNNLT